MGHRPPLLTTVAVFGAVTTSHTSAALVGALEGGDWTGRHRCSFSADIAASGVGGFYTQCFQFFFTQRNQPAKGARILKPVLHAIALFG